MRTIKLIFLGLALALPLSVLAEASLPSERAIRSECGGGASVEMRDCLEKKAQHSQKVLKQAEKKVVAAIAKWNGSNKANLTRAKLAASNRGFIKYRRAHCEFMPSSIGGSLGHDFMRFACLAELNYTRAKQLRDVANEFSGPSGMPPGTAMSLAEEADNSQRALSQAENETNNTAKWDEDSYIRLFKEKLAATNKEFVKFRSAHCEFMAMLNKGNASGSQNIRQLACVAELNNKRAMQLHDVATGLNERAKRLHDAGWFDD